VKWKLLQLFSLSRKLFSLFYQFLNNFLDFSINNVEIIAVEIENKLTARKGKESKMTNVKLISKTGKILRSVSDGENVWVTEGSFYNPCQTTEEEFLSKQARGIVKDGLAYFKGSAKIEVLAMLDAPQEMMEKHNRNWDMTISLKIEE